MVSRSSNSTNRRRVVSINGGMDSGAESEQSEFVQMLTDAQPLLFSYISMLLGGVQEAGNVLQETNLVLWKKAAEYSAGTSFMAWAREIAYFKALSHIRDQKRSRLILDQARIEGVLASEPTWQDHDDRRLALRHCLTTLSDEQIQLLRMRYTSETPVNEIAMQTGKSEGAVKMALRRIRIALMECIQRQLGVSHA